MKKNNKNDLKVYIMLENHPLPDELYYIRYFQIWRYLNDKFYWIVYDYTGGWNYEEVFFAENQDIYTLLMPDDVDENGDSYDILNSYNDDIWINECIDYLNNTWIITTKEIYDFLNTFSKEDNNWQANIFIINPKKLYDLFGKWTDDNYYYYMGNNIIENHITIGNTYFE